jgi:hypothetical protein
MAYEALAKIKEMGERMKARVDRMKEATEKTMHQAFAIVEINAGLAGWGYANERWGDAPADDPTGYREVKLFNVPADLIAGLGLLGVSMFGGLGTYAEHGLNLGNASTGAFSYRLGGEAGRRAQAKAQTTSGAPAQMTGARPGAQGGRVHHVEYAR